MRVVVVGGTGRIGTYLVPSLVKAGHDTVLSAVDLEPGGYPPTLDVMSVVPVLAVLPWDP